MNDTIKVVKEEEISIKDLKEQYLHQLERKNRIEEKIKELEGLATKNNIKLPVTREELDAEETKKSEEPVEE